MTVREVAPGVLVCPDAETLAAVGAERFAALAAEFAARAGAFTVALAGGSTPQEMYRRLAEEPLRAQVPWERVRIFFGDERAVPPDHERSNYGAARRALLDRVPIPAKHIHRMEAERDPIGPAAQEYEDLLAAHLLRDLRGIPRLDLILLGMGADGHTASLFPTAHNPAGTSRWVIAPWVEAVGERRMTLTLPVLNAAHHVLFLVAGEEKAAALARVVAGDEALPAARVRPDSGQRIILADAAAAAELPGAASPGAAR